MSARLLPAGTVTFLFTDIERSTETAAVLGDELYAETLQEHRAVLRPVFDRHGGVEVATEGDAFFVAFARAAEAVGAAIDGQRALEERVWPSEAPIRVRMGVHTGEVVVQDDDYVGHDVHKAKRISDAGHGGQILMSAITAGLVSGHLPMGASVDDLGLHRLKDLEEAQRIFQVSAEGLPSEFPPLRSLDTFRQNLPAQRSMFIGREHEIAQVRKLLERHRLVTLTGVGGCGKTRLALQVGAELLDHYIDGVFFVDLAPLADPDVIAATVAKAVGVPMRVDLGTGPTASASDLLVGFLSARSCLVILDNCEHLLDGAAELADLILTNSPDLSLLATSREALDVEGEQSWRVPSLSVPHGSDIATSESVSLFKARAQAVRADFDLSPANVDAVTRICLRLDGLPLAIEFAAARVAHMSPEEIADRLSDMFTLLSGGRRRRVQRQQTLEATLDWSYELLSESERVLLRRLAVFPGTFSLPAAEAICGQRNLARLQVLDLLGSLVAKSLVTSDNRDGKTHYRLIEPVRAYAAEKLREAGEADAFRGQHRDWFLAWLRTISWEEALFGARGEVEGLDADESNIRAALEWSESEGRSDLILAMAARASSLWTTYGHAEEGYRWLTAGRPEEIDLTTEERVTAMAVAAWAANALQYGTALDLAERAIAAAGASRPLAMVRALGMRAVNLAIGARAAGNPELADTARRQCADAETLAGGVVGARAWNALMRGTVEIVLGDVARAAEAYKIGASVLRQESARLRPTWGMDWVVPSLATAQLMLGDVEAAAETVSGFVDHLWSDDWGAGSAHFGAMAAAVVLAAQGDIEGGRGLLTRYLDEVRPVPAGLEMMMVSFAGVAYIAGDVPNASRLLSWVSSRTLAAGRIIPHPIPFGLHEHYLRLVRQSLLADQARQLKAEGAAMSEDDAIACALASSQP